MTKIRKQQKLKIEQRSQLFLEKFKKSDLSSRLSQRASPSDCDTRAPSTLPAQSTEPTQAPAKSPQETKQEAFDQPTPKQSRPAKRPKARASKDAPVYSSGLDTARDTLDTHEPESNAPETTESPCTEGQDSQKTQNRAKRQSAYYEVARPTGKTRRKKKRKKNNNRKGWNPSKLTIKKPKDGYDISSSFVHVSEYKKPAPTTADAVAIQDHSSQFLRVVKSYSTNKDFDFAVLQTKYFTASTFVKLKNYNLFLAADSPAHPDYRPGKPCIQVYRQAYDSAKNRLKFDSLLTQSVHQPVRKLLLNGDEDLLVVVFDNAEMQLFYIEHSVISVGGNTFSPRLALDPIDVEGLAGQQFSADSATMLELNPSRVRLKDPRKNAYFKKRSVKYSMQNTEHLAVFNKTSRRLEFYDISNLDRVSCCMSFALRNLPTVTRIVPLESNWIALGCSGEALPAKPQSLVAMNLQNMEYVLTGWSQLDGVGDLVYDRDNGLLFVASASKCFSALQFDASTGKATLLGAFTVGAKSEQLSLRIFRSRQTCRPNRLMVSDGSDHLYTYLIRQNGKPEVTCRRPADAGRDDRSVHADLRCRQPALEKPVYAGRAETGQKARRGVHLQD